MQMDEGLDTGPMLLKRSYTLQPDETSASLYKNLLKFSHCTLWRTQALEKGQLPAEPQDDAYATRRQINQRRSLGINWQHSAQHIERQIRGFNPVSCTPQNNTMSIKVWKHKL